MISRPEDAKLTRPIRRPGLALPTALVLSSVLFAPAAAKAQLFAAAEGTYNNEILSGSWGLGARAGLELPRIGITRPELVGAFVYYFPSCGGNTCDWWEWQGTVLFYGPTPGPADPYLGVGLSYHEFNVDTNVVDGDDIGFDILLGTKLSGSTVRPYFEVRYKIMNDVPRNQLVFTFGLRLGN